MEKDLTKIEKQIADWKKQYGKVFKSKVGDVDVYWRKLKRKEYVEISSGDYDFYQKQEETCKAAILNMEAEELEVVMEENAGFSITLSEEILFYSGFNITTTEV